VGITFNESHDATPSAEGLASSSCWVGAFASITSSSQHFALHFIPLFISPGREHLCTNCRCTEMNALKPDLMTAAERLNEVAEILAAGLMRLRARQSTAESADFGEGSLDCAGDQSGHANVLRQGGMA
jgi:hypothetical protein